MGTLLRIEAALSFLSLPSILPGPAELVGL
jgi:hypothetical protein